MLFGSTNNMQAIWHHHPIRTHKKSRILLKITHSQHQFDTRECSFWYFLPLLEFVLTSLQDDILYNWRKSLLYSIGNNLKTTPTLTILLMAQLLGSYLNWYDTSMLIGTIYRFSFNRTVLPKKCTEKCTENFQTTTKTIIK